MRNVTFTKSDCSTVAAFLTYAGAHVQSLRIDKIEEQHADVLRQILQSCPRLDTLTVDAMESVEPLLLAYQEGRCSMSTLSSGRLSSDAQHDIFRTLGDQESRMAKLVRRIRLDRTSVEPDQMEHAVRLLLASARIQFLMLDEVRDDDELDVGDGYFEPFVDRPLTQNAASKQAAYTFLLAVRRRRVSRLVLTPCLEAIVAFAATPVLRPVSWREMR